MQEKCKGRLSVYRALLASYNDLQGLYFPSSRNCCRYMMSHTFHVGCMQVSKQSTSYPALLQ